jgi:hypothetical protein
VENENRSNKMIINVIREIRGFLRGLGKNGISLQNICNYCIIATIAEIGDL